MPVTLSYQPTPSKHLAELVLFLRNWRVSGFNEDPIRPHARSLALAVRRAYGVREHEYLWQSASSSKAPEPGESHLVV